MSNNKYIFATTIICTALFLTACTNGTPSSEESNTDTNSNSTIEEQMETSETTYSSAPEMQIDPSKEYVATLKTNQGDIKVGLFAANAPKTVNNFVSLAKDDFYDGIIFHRVIAGFMIQGGDPTGTGGGDAGYKFEDEINADSLGLGDTLLKDADFLKNMLGPQDIEEYGEKTVKEVYEMMGYEYTTEVESKKMLGGVLAMANAGPNTNGSQFFIVSEKPQPHLDGKHTVFGEIIEGMDVAMKIESLPTDRMDKPIEDVVIEDIVIEEIAPEEAE